MSLRWSRSLLREERLWLIGITLVGGALRLWNLDAAQYGYDDELVVSRAWAIVKEGARVLSVPSSLAVPNGPVAPYVLALPMLFSSSHSVLATFIAGINIASIPLFYLIGKAVFGPRVGVILALLAAVNPWLVTASRRLWLNALLAPSALLLLWAMHRAVRTKSLGMWSLLGATAAINAQIHLSSLSNLLALAGAMLPFLRALLLRPVTVAAAVALVVALPWVSNVVLPDVQRSNLAERGPEQAVQEPSLERASLLVTGVGYQTLTGHAAGIIDATAVPFQLLDILARALALAGWAWLMWSAWDYRVRDPARAATCLLAALMIGVPIVGVAILVSRGLLAYPNWWYFYNLVPAILLGLAAVIDRVWRRLPRVGPILCAVVAGPHVLLAFPFLIAQEEYWPLAGYGMPWKHTEVFVREVDALARRDHAFVVVGGIGWDDYARAEVVARILSREYGPVRMTDPRDGLIYRTDRSVFVFVATDEEHLLTRLFRDEMRAPQVVYQEIPGHGWVRRVFRIERDALERWAAERMAALPSTVSDGAGVSYERAGLVLVGGRSHLGLLWRFDADPTEPVFTEAIFRADGRELHRETHLAYPAAFWQRGDWLDTRMLNLFELPPSLEVTQELTLSLQRQGAVSGRRYGQPVQMGLSRQAAP